MPEHPLKTLNDRRKYLFSKGGEDFYLRVVTTATTMEKYPEAAAALTDIPLQSRKSFEKMELKGGRKLTQPSENFRRDLTTPAAWIQRGFNDQNRKFQSNQTVLILENKKGDFVTAMLFAINDARKRESSRVPPKIGTFVYLGDAATAEKYQGRGFFSATFDKVVTMLGNDKYKLPKPFLYSISMSAVTSIADDGSHPKEHIMNLSAYAKMWQERFPCIKIQDRWQLQSGPQFGGERKLIADILDNSKRIDPIELDYHIANRKELAELQNKIPEEELKSGTSPQQTSTEKIMFRGLYLEGSTNETHDALKQQKDAQMKRKGLERPEEKRKGWHDVQNPTATTLKEQTRSKL